MSARALALVLLSLAGCKTKEEPSAAASAPLDRRGRCEKIGEQATQLGVLVARGLVSGLSEGKQQLGEDAELKAGLDAARSELVEDCMTWSEETLDCFGSAALLNGEKCDRLLAEALGETPPPPPAPAGPPPRWSATLPEDIALLHGCADGSALVVTEHEAAQDDAEGGATLLSIAEGKTRWSKPLPGSPWSLEPLDDTAVLVVLPDALLAIELADGRERWRAQLPGGADEPQIRAVLREGDRCTLLDDARRVLSVELARCSKGACIERIGTLPLDDPESSIGLELSGELQLARLTDGGLVIAAPDEHRVVVLGDELRLRFAFESRAGLSWVYPREGELVAAMDGEVLALAPSECGDKGKTFAPATWPPPGTPDWLREVSVREDIWSRTPEGCVAWRRALPIAELADAPVPGIDDAMIVQAGGMLFALTPTGERWKSSVAAQSLAVAHGDAIAVLGDVGKDDTQLAMMWISPADGSHVAHSEIALGKGQYFLLDGPQLVAAGPSVVAGYARELVAFGR